MSERAETFERALRIVGADLDFPSDVDVAGAVAARLRASRSPRRFAVPGLRSRNAFRPVVRPAWHTVAAAALVLFLVAAGTISVWTPARQAVAGWLGLRGVQIRLVPSPPTGAPPATTPAPVLGADLALGEPVSLARAQAVVPYRIQQPHDSALGAPDVVYESPSLSNGLVSLVYGARPGLATGSNGVSVLFMQFTAKIDKGFLLQKAVGPGTKLEAVRIHGEPGFWLSGEMHGFAFVGRSGAPLFDSQRLAGNVLLWQDGDRVFRLEGAFTKAQALAIARSVH